MRDLASIFLCTWTVKGRNLGISALQTQTFHQVESKSRLGCRWRMRLFWASHQAMLSDPTFINNEVNILAIGQILICSLIGEEELVLFMSPPQKMPSPAFGWKSEHVDWIPQLSSAEFQAHKQWCGQAAW